MMMTLPMSEGEGERFPEDDSSPIYSPAMEESQFDAREADNRRAFMLFGGAIAVLLLIAFLVLKAYGGGTRGPDEPPRIIADTSPYKSAPEDPGGSQTPNQDISVYDRINGEPGAEDVTIVEDSEVPMPAPTGVQIGIRGQEDAPAQKPAVKPVATPVTTPTPAPVVSSPGSYAVQVAALRSQAEAETMWTSFTGKFGGILPAASGRDINRVDRGARGTFYQLRVAGFDSKDSANTFCATLKARGQDCLVVRR